MDNAQKAIMIGVGLFITIIIIAAVMLITGMGQNLLNKGTDKVAGISAQLDQTELEEYDNKMVNGTRVLSAVKKYWTDENIVIYVDNGTTAQRKYTTALKVDNIASPTKTVENTTHGTDSAGNYDPIATGTNACPIGTATRYKAELIKINSSAVGVKFTKQ